MTVHLKLFDVLPLGFGDGKKPLLYGSYITKFNGVFELLEIVNFHRVVNSKC